MTTQKEQSIVNLYRDSFPDFARMISRMGGTLEQAKDSFHDALLIYLEKERAGNLHHVSSPKAYLLGTAKICWLHTQGKGSALPLPEGFDPPQPADANPAYLAYPAYMADSEDSAYPAYMADSEEREQTLLDALAKTGKKCLELLKAFYYEHCSMQDIAGRFGFNGRRSATVQKYKCLEKVREQIAREQLTRKPLTRKQLPR